MTVLPLNSGKPRTCVTLNGSGIQLAVGPQPLWLRNHNSGPAKRIMVKRLATSPHDPLGITDSACKNQLVVINVQYGPFNPYIAIRSTTIGKSRVALDLIAMHTSWRSNSDIASVTRSRESSRGPDYEIYRRLPLKCQFPCESSRSLAPRRQQGQNLKLRLHPRERDPDPPLRQHIDDMEPVLDRFHPMNPPTFIGADGGLEAERWIV
ncbi:hypothetical protein F511_04528 [Dorcoceras hygrometricum]|uniref:Uncharacterized protein n=1 Tax=Dorcoceras hygrometricum TaxID=472368 RepID=A0A2Z7C5K5_9LAMI|nr:hypothetical protein F511_04528 [Dorcoceras hygrometricum]